MSSNVPPSMASSMSVASSSVSSGTRRAAERKLNTPPSYVTEAQQTLLYFRAVDADAPDSVLGDIYAKQLVNKIPLDVVETMGQDLRYVKFWCLRARRIDQWCRDFITDHPHCTVLNLSCGLDTRVNRLQPLPASVRWIDTDHPDVVAFRLRVFPQPNGDYRLSPVDITDSDPDSWVSVFPTDRPTLVIGESNMFYLPPVVARGILHSIADHFSQGHIIFDVLGSLCASLINMRMATVQKKTGMKILWPVDDPRKVAQIHPRLHLIDEMRYTEDMPPWFGEFKTKLLKLLPGYRNLGRVILLGFGDSVRQSESRGMTSLSDSLSNVSSGAEYFPGMAESLSRVSTYRS
jgi:O-methyltransferase involved in polyketide biosynthesis